MSAQNNGAFTLNFRLATEAGLPVDLTGWALEADLRRMPAATAVADLSTANGRIVITSAAAGTFEFRVPYSVASTLKPGTVWFDVVRVGNGDPIPLFRGHFPILQGITR